MMAKQLVMKFDSRPRYERGDRYCRKYRIVYSGDVEVLQCVFCRHVLSSNPLRRGRREKI